MQCLTDYIGLQQCKGGTPESGLYLNGLPGISLKSVDDIADSDQQTYANVWTDVQKRALQKFSTDVNAEFGKRYKIKTITDTAHLPKVVDTSDTTAAAEELRGVTLELAPEDAAYLPSGLQVIHVQKLEAYFNGEVEGLEFKVIDLDTGEVLETFEEDVAVGWNTIALNKDYYATRIFIGYVATAVTSVKLTLPASYNCNCHIVSDIGYDCCGMSIKGAVYNEDSGDLEQGVNSFGVSAIVAVKCKFDALVCNTKSVFATALWYLLGSEMMSERIYSDRLNRYTTIDRDRAKEMRNEWREQYSIELNSAIDGINLNHFDCCLECAAQLQYQEVTL